MLWATGIFEYIEQASLWLWGLLELGIGRVLRSREQMSYLYKVTSGQGWTGRWKDVTWVSDSEWSRCDLFVTMLISFPGAGMSGLRTTSKWKEVYKFVIVIFLFLPVWHIFEWCGGEGNWFNFFGEAYSMLFESVTKIRYSSRIGSVFRDNKIRTGKRIRASSKDKQVVEYSYLIC